LNSTVISRLGSSGSAHSPPSLPATGQPLTHRWELNPIPQKKADFANVVVETVAVQPKLGTSPEVLFRPPRRQLRRESVNAKHGSGNTAHASDWPQVLKCLNKRRQTKFKFQSILTMDPNNNVNPPSPQPTTPAVLKMPSQVPPRPHLPVKQTSQP